MQPIKLSTSAYDISERSAAATDSDEPESLLRAAEVQIRLGLSRAKVYRLMQKNVLPTVRIGGSIRVPRRALARWIEDNTHPGTKISLGFTATTY